MSTTTPNLGLFKYDPSTDGKEVFSITTALNDNWDKIDNLDPLPDQTGKSGCILTTDGSKTSWGSTAEVHCIIETYMDGTSWYRLYSDGWCEQGGYVSSIPSGTAGVTVTFLKSFANGNYFSIPSWGSADYAAIAVGNRTTIDMKIFNRTNYANWTLWYVCGYAEV